MSRSGTSYDVVTGVVRYDLSVAGLARFAVSQAKSASLSHGWKGLIELARLPTSQSLRNPMKLLVMPGQNLSPLSKQQVNRIFDLDNELDLIEASGEEAIRQVRDADVVFGSVNQEMFAGCTRLKWVHATTAGVGTFMFREFIESDVVLTSEKGLVGHHLADHAFSLLLMLTRQTGAAIALGRNGWLKRKELRTRTFELTGKTMGCYGFGGTGRAVARRAKAFGMNVLALARESAPATDEVAEVWGCDRFDELLRNSDVVAICCPLTRETQGKFDAEAFRLMKSSAILVNVTQGEIVDEQALVAALQAEEIAGAALDVFEREPLSEDSPFWTMPQVVMSPHTAGASQLRSDRNLDRFCGNLERFLRGDELEGLVNKKLGY